MNYAKHINLKAEEYKKYLLDDLKINKDFTNLVNSVFFPSNLDIEVWLREVEVKSFHEYKRLKKDFFFNRICNRYEIDGVQLLNKISVGLSRYTFFSFLKYDSYEEANEKAQSFYYLTQKPLYEIVDKIIFDRLKEYKRETTDIHLYTKRISNQASLTLCINREYVGSQGIFGYTFPSLSINIEGHNSLEFGTIDVRTLLFLPATSFFFFYLDSHSYTIEEKSSFIKDVVRKDDEPVIYYLKEEQKYMVTNSWQNIDRYNKYIHIILELSFHYFEILERWLIRLLKEES